MGPDRVVFIVESDGELAAALQRGFGQEGFVAVPWDRHVDVFDQFDELQPDVVLLNVMLDGRSGTDVCREIRRHSTVPILMIGLSDSELDAVVSLEVGADDFVSRPARQRELVARTRAVLRRSGGARERRGRTEQAVLCSGDVRVDVERREVTVRGTPVSVPRKEFEVLRLLVAANGRVITREALFAQAWGPGFAGDQKTLDVHIKRLRTRIEVDPADPKYIVTVRGVGFRFLSQGGEPVG